MFLLFFVLGWNFFISWMNASYVGKYWTESKEVGGSFRAYIVTGYVMAIAGFTMVYGYLALLALPFILLRSNVDSQIIMEVESLSSDLIYLFSVLTMIPTGFFIWIRSLKNVFENVTFSHVANAGRNSYAQVHNTLSAARNAPSALKRVANSLFGGKGKKKDNTVVILGAIFILILVIFGGYFTASAIMKKADREYDAFGQ